MGPGGEPEALQVLADLEKGIAGIRGKEIDGVPSLPVLLDYILAFYWCERGPGDVHWELNRGVGCRQVDLKNAHLHWGSEDLGLQSLLD